MGKETVMKKTLISGEKNSEAVEILYDTGAARSLIKSSLCERLTQYIIPLQQSLKLRLADGKNMIEAHSLANLYLGINGYKLPMIFYTVNNLARDVILGIDNMQAWEMKIDFKTKEIIVGLTPDELFFY